MNTQKNGSENIDRTIENAATPFDVSEPAKVNRQTLYGYLRDKMSFSHLAAVLAVHTLEKGGGFNGSGGTNEAFPGGVEKVSQLKPKTLKWLHANQAAIERWAASIDERHADAAPNDLGALLAALGAQPDDDGEADDIRKGRV